MTITEMKTTAYTTSNEELTETAGIAATVAKFIVLVWGDNFTPSQGL
jgi:hypothetical protein